MKTIKPIFIISSFLLILISCQDNPKKNEIATTSVPTDKLISTETAKAYITEYDSVKYEAINKATGKKDAKHFYYTVEELEGYLAYVKNKAKEQNVSVSGLAISLGAYPEDARKGYDNYTTIILRPYGTRNGVSYLVPPNGTEIINSISAMNESTSTPPEDPPQ